MVRVIAGTARGSKLKTVDSDATRPTLDRVKEAMFSMLMPYLPGAYVLDLFSGNGSLGIEALSRGAAKCVFNDKSRECCGIIRENAAKVGFGDRAEVFSLDFSEMISKAAGRRDRFDMLLLDPPYGKELIGSSVMAFERAGIYSEKCVILAEHSVNDILKEKYGKFVLVKTKKYGTVAVSVYMTEAAGNGEES